MNENVPSTSPRNDGADTHQSLFDVVRTWLRGLGRRLNGTSGLRETVEELVKEYSDEDLPFDAEERAMLRNLLKFGELRVDDVMVPRADIVAVEQSTALADVVQVMGEAGRSRLPVYRDTLDDIVGMVHVRDLLRFWGADKPFALNEMTRRLLFVPPSMRVRDLLLQMRVTRVHMAMVVDEYGGTDGLVTIEDLVEEIVGEIRDEHDVDELPMLVDKPNGVIEADARVPVDDLEARIGIDLLPDDQEERVDTLGGLVFSLVGRVPSRGELINHPAGLQFEVVDADPRRIRRLRIHHAPSAPASG
ncbi:MAG: hemolysin family protein [Alphaproteobacteria bacterium]